MQRFPAMRILLRYGKWITLAIALSLPCLAWWATLQFGIPGWGLIIAAVLLAVVVWFILSVFVELVRVIAEILMPT